MCLSIVLDDHVERVHACKVRRYDLQMKIIDSLFRFFVLFCMTLLCFFDVDKNDDDDGIRWKAQL